MSSIIARIENVQGEHPFATVITVWFWIIYNLQQIVEISFYISSYKLKVFQ